MNFVALNKVVINTLYLSLVYLGDEPEASKLLIEQAFYNISRAVFKRNMFEKNQRYLSFIPYPFHPSHPIICPSNSTIH